MKDYVYVGWDNDIILVGDDPPLLNKMVLAKYNNEIVKLEDSNMCVGDGIWFEFKRYEIIHLKRLKIKNCHCTWIWTVNRLFDPEEISTIDKSIKKMQINHKETQRGSDN